jgi:hypothetical protein
MATIYSLQRQDRVFIVPETTYGTLVEYAGTHEVKVLPGGTIEYSQERVPNEDNDLSRDVTSLIDMRKTGTFSFSTYVKPNATGNTEPDIFDLLKIFFTTVTNNATDTAWFHKLIGYPVCFTRGRIRFKNPDGPDLGARQGQAIFYLGNNIDLFAKVFNTFGVVMVMYDNTEPGRIS